MRAKVIKFCIITERCVLCKHKVFNKLPVNIAQLVTDKKRFISVLKGFLITEAFYSINEFFDYQEMIIEH
jgi:hypothetical protein